MRAEAHRKEATNPCLCGSTSSEEIPCGSPAIVCCHLPCGFWEIGVFSSWRPGWLPVSCHHGRPSAWHMSDPWSIRGLPGLGTKVEVRVRAARVREGKHLLELHLWASLAPAEAHAKLQPSRSRVAPTPRFCWSYPILWALDCEDGTMWRMMLSPLGAIGH